MNIFLWILQILMAAAFAVSGTVKLTQPKEKLRGQMHWVDSVTTPQLRGIGGVEVLGAIGLILPWALDIARVLTPIAAVGLAIVMVCAAVVHARLKEYQQIGINAVLFVLVLIVAIGRFAG